MFWDKDKTLDMQQIELSICWLRNSHTYKRGGGLHRKKMNQE